MYYPLNKQIPRISASFDYCKPLNRGLKFYVTVGWFVCPDFYTPMGRWIGPVICQKKRPGPGMNLAGLFPDPGCKGDRRSLLSPVKSSNTSDFDKI